MTDSTFCLSWAEFHRDTRALARQLLNQPFKGIICIARGGLVPGAILARELDLRIVDTLCIASYDHDKQGEIEVLKSIEGDGEGYLLVDDLVDTGNTAGAAKELLPKAKLAAVYAKPQGRPAADYVVREFAQDIWLHFPWDIDYRFTPPIAAQ